MAKNVEIGFVIGAALAGGFSSAFGKAGQAVSELKNQTAGLQKTSGQVSAYQKLQSSVAGDEKAMIAAREQAKALETQITSSQQKTSTLKSQYRESNAEVERLNAVFVRNKDAYNAAKLNVQSLERQIKNSTAPTAELQKRYTAAQEEARKLGAAVKQSSAALQKQKTVSKSLNSEIQQSVSKTKAFTNEAKSLNSQANQLQAGIGRNKESLAQLDNELKKAGIDTNNLSKEQARLAEQSQRAEAAQIRLNNAQANYDSIKSRLSWNNIKGDVIASATMAYSLYKPVSQAADFESAMARVNAVAFSGAGRNKEQDAKDLKALQEQARQLGRETQFTAVQAANSQENLARAGFKTNEIISAMPGLLAMAAAEGMDLATGADIMASTLRGFNLSADQASRVSNVLAQTSAASNTSIVALGDSMKYVAPQAAGLGIPLEEVSAMLGVFADAGIKGSQGGTALRAAFSRLSKEPKAVAKALSALGVKSRDSNGNMRDMTELLTVLDSKLKKFGKADKQKYLANIFGAEAAPAMLALMESVKAGKFQERIFQNYGATGELQAIIDFTNHGREEAVVSLEEMRSGMENIIPLAQYAGITFKDLSIYTAMLATSGIKGAKAEKGLTEVFTKLSQKPQELNKALKKYNLSAFTKEGKLKEFHVLLKEISATMGSMKEPEQLKELANIFGGDGAKIIQSLMKEVPKAYEGYDKAAGKAKGIAYEMMEKNLATLNGKLEIAKSAISDFMIEIGNVLLPHVTKLVEVFGEITASITKIMQDYPVVTKVVVGSLEAIATVKIVRTIGGIGTQLLNLSGAWLEVHRATREAATIAGTVTTAIGGTAGSVSNLGSLISALLGPLGLVAAAVALIALNWEDVCAWCEKAGEAMKNIDRTTPTAELKPNTSDYHIRAMESAFAIPGTYATGGIVNNPTLSWVGEAGREAVIPLEKQARGTALWIEAGRELGLISENNTMPSIINASKVHPEIAMLENQSASRVIPHATGGIFSTPHIGLVAEAGREAVIPLENQKRGENLWLMAGQELGLIKNFTEIPDIKIPEVQSEIQNVMPSIINALKFQPEINPVEMPGIKNIIPNVANEIFSTPNLGFVAEAGREAVIPLENKASGIPLWKAAGEGMGLLFGNTTNNNDNHSNSVILSPSFNITVNGGEQGIEQKFRQIVEDVLNNLKNDMERVSFA